MAPRAIHAFGPGDDFTMLDLDSAAFNLADRGVAGMPDPGPLDAFVWLDRGIYRPGETVQVMALLRDDSGQPAELPAHVTVRRPNGQVFQETTPTRGPDASLYLPVKLSAGAPVGAWSVEVRADPAAPPIGRATFRVDAFVPDRMAVDLGPATGPIVPGRPYALPVAARFLVRRARRRADRQGDAPPGAGRRAVPGARRLPHRAGERDLRPRRQGHRAEGHRRAGPHDLPDPDPPRAGHLVRAEGGDRRGDQRPLRPRLARADRDQAAPGRAADRHQAAVQGPRRGCRDRGRVRHRRGRSGRQAGGDGGEAAAGARAAGLAAGDARQPGTLRDGLARRTVAHGRAADPGRRAAALRSKTGLRRISY